jgi:hypothetical protein
MAKVDESEPAAAAIVEKMANLIADDSSLEWEKGIIVQMDV